jgi:hypothetical protein
MPSGVGRGFRQSDLLVLGQRAVDAKSNKITAITEILKVLHLKPLISDLDKGKAISLLVPSARSAL